MGELVALTIFIVTYFLISVQRLPVISIGRPSGSLFGAVMMVLLGVLTFDEAFGAIDFKTIVLLLGMMVIVGYLALAGFLDFVSYQILRRSKTQFQLLCLVVLSSGIISALFVNDTVCIVYAPIIIRAVRIAKLSPLPYLIALATSANIGSAATIVGNPQNMLIGTQSKIPFIEFSQHMLPVAALGLLLDIGIIYILFRKQFEGAYTVDVEEPEVDMPLMKKSISVFWLVLLGFLFGGAFISIPMAAITGALVMLFIGKRSPDKVLKNVDWALLLFFCNLFIVTYGVEKSGLSESMLEFFGSFFALEGLPLILGISAFGTLVSNLVSNVPFVMMMLPLMSGLGTSDTTWYTLAMSSTFAGNLTIFGSVANMIVVESSRKFGVYIGFFEFAKAGAIITFATVLLGSIILAL